MTQAKRILAMLLAAAVFLAGGPYGSTLPAALASINAVAGDIGTPCGQCCDEALPRCVPNVPCGLGCPQLPALPAAAGSAPPLAERGHLVPLPVSRLAGLKPRPDLPPPRS